jgi:GT2 family glycosyltransferase
MKINLRNINSPNNFANRAFMKPVFIIILNYNGEYDTIACIDSLIESNYNPISICIIDNGSEKEKTAVLETYLYKIQMCFGNNIISSIEEIDINKRNLIFISNDDNLGFAAGNNVGIKMALQAGFEFVLLLNNDTLVEADFLDKLMLFFISHPHYVAITPKICWESHRNIVWNCGGNLTWYKNRRYCYTGTVVENTPQTGSSDITFITGCALLFKPKETGLLS